MIAKRLIVADRKSTARQEELCDFFLRSLRALSLSLSVSFAAGYKDRLYDHVAADE